MVADCCCNLTDFCRSKISCRTSKKYFHKNKVDKFGRVHVSIPSLVFILFSFLYAASAQSLNDTPAVSANDTSYNKVVSATTLRVPTKAWNHLQAAQKNFSKSNLREAEQEIEQALKIDPDFPQAFTVRALLKLADQDGNGALGDAKRATSLDPNDAESYVALGTTYNYLKQFSEAQAAATKALSISPTSWHAQLELVKSVYGQGQFALALQELDALHKDFPDAHLIRGNALMRLHRPQEASLEFQAFLKEAPGDPRESQIQQILAAR